jgi:hypothetical protein
VIAAYVIIQQVEGHTLNPCVMMRTVKINPLTVVVAVILGTELLGHHRRHPCAASRRYRRGDPCARHRASLATARGSLFSRYTRSDSGERPS